MRILILGGTTEARRLAEAVAKRSGFDATLSLAGRTDRPLPLPLPVRTGGFGGAEGLAAHLREMGTDAVVDATHPFAERISANAAAACAAAGVPLCRIARPAWAPGPGDRWTEVADMAEAVRALGDAPRRVFLTVGRLSLPAFEAAPQHAYLVRTVDPPDPPPALPRLEVVTAVGPFGLEAERALLRDRGIEVLVTKNSGGTATRAKLDAARELGVPVVMVRMPDPPAGVTVAETWEEALGWLEAHALASARSAAFRGE